MKPMIRVVLGLQFYAYFFEDIQGMGRAFYKDSHLHDTLGYTPKIYMAKSYREIIAIIKRRYKIRKCECPLPQFRFSKAYQHFEVLREINS